MTVTDAPPTVDWQQRAQRAERQVAAVLTECWVLRGQRHAPTLGIAAKRIEAVVTAAGEEPDV